MLVEFTTDASGDAQGWTLNWRNTAAPKPTCGGVYLLTNATGLVTDGSGGSSYTNNLYCQWLITPEGAEYVQLTLGSLVTESSLDTLTFYDGATTSSPVIQGPLSGTLTSGIIPPFYSTGNTVLAVFRTDSSDGYGGWSFNYEAKNGTEPTCGGNLLSIFAHYLQEVIQHLPTQDHCLMEAAQATTLITSIVCGHLV